MLAPLWPLVSLFKPCALHFCVLVLHVCMLEIKFNSIQEIMSHISVCIQHIGHLVSNIKIFVQCSERIKLSYPGRF